MGFVIFDLKNTKDLSIKTLGQLKSARFSKSTSEMISLFEIKKILTIDEILVGIFRLYKIEQTRDWARTTADNLTRRGILKKVNRGQYEIVKKIEDI
jgi:predicted transcriptional regulator of viral defense system